MRYIETKEKVAEAAIKEKAEARIKHNELRGKRINFEKFKGDKAWAGFRRQKYRPSQRGLWNAAEQ